MYPLKSGVIGLCGVKSHWELVRDKQDLWQPGPSHFLLIFSL